MKRISVILLLLVIVGADVCAQQEDWDTYMSQIGGKPGSILVDMELAKKAPLKLYPYLVVTGPKAEKCNDYNRLPDTSEIAKLETILGASGGFLSGVTPKKLAGTLTYNCERVNYYYVKDTTRVRAALARMYAIHYKNRNYTIKTKYDPLWTTYRTFLYPDSTASSWMNINKQLVQMLRHGDDLIAPRQIAHTLYFMTDSGRAQFNAAAVDEGYTVSKVFDADAGKALRFETTVTKDGSVIADSIMAMQSILQPLARLHKGYYKQWDASK